MSQISPSLRRAMIAALSVFLFVLLLGPYFGFGRGSGPAAFQEAAPPPASADATSRPDLRDLFSEKARPSPTTRGPEKPQLGAKRSKEASSKEKFSEIEDLLGN